MSEYWRNRSRYDRERDNPNQDDWMDMAERRLQSERQRDQSFHRPDWVNDNYDDEMGGVWSETWGRGYQSNPNASGRDYGYNPSQEQVGGYYGRDYNRGYNYSWGGVSDWRRRPGRYTGVGPKGYQRPDERIQEEANDRLTWHGDIDATNITVTAKDGEITLEGTVEDRRQKRLAEDIVEGISGVKDVHNHLHLEKTWLGEIVDRVTGKEHEDKPETGQTRART